MKRRKRKAFYNRERDSFEGPYEEVEVLQHKAFKQGENLAFSKDTCLEKGSVRSKQL